jgi:hypothetical protein
VPFLVLAMPFVARILVSFPRIVVVVVMALVLATSVPALFWNNTRSLLSKSSILRVDRELYYFAKHWPDYPFYRQSAAILSEINCRDLGLKIGSDTWEYPWWIVTGWPRASIRIEHIDVDNASAASKYPLSTFNPCAIIEQARDSMPNKVSHDGHSYYGVRTYPSSLTLYLHEKYATAPAL